MARMAAADGVVALAATPHINPEMFPNTPENIRLAFEAFHRAVTVEGIPLALHSAAEVHLHPATFALAEAGTLPCFNREGETRRYFLLEFPHHGIDPDALERVRAFIDLGYTPLLAHPERNPTFKREPDALLPYLELGCLTQLTGYALTGGAGRRAQRTGELFLERGWIHVIASDGHGFFSSRAPVLSDGERAAARLIGPERAHRLVADNPAAILRGEPLS